MNIFPLSLILQLCMQEYSPYSTYGVTIKWLMIGFLFGNSMSLRSHLAQYICQYKLLTLLLGKNKSIFSRGRNFVPYIQSARRVLRKIIFLNIFTFQRIRIFLTEFAVCLSYTVSNNTNCLINSEFVS